MTALAIASPLPQFFDLDGSPLTGGALYFGSVDANPETSPVPVYWDADLTQPAAQPVRTSNGYAMRAGTASPVYAAADHSMLVRDSKGRQILYARNSGEINSAAALRNRLASMAAGDGAALVGVEDAAGNFSGTNAEDVLAEISANSAFLARAGETLSDVALRITSGVIDLRAGSYPATDVQLLGQSLRGRGTTATTLLASGTSEVVRLGYVNSPSQWTWRSVEDLTVSGNLKASDGVSFESAVNPDVAGRWELDRVTLLGCNRGVYKTAGNIGNTYQNVNFRSCNYGFYAVGSTVPLMHAGCDTFIGGEFSNNTLAGVYIDSAQLGTGQTRFTQTVFESNPGFAVFIKNYEGRAGTLTFDGVWFEGNASSGSVTINGTAYTPKDLYLENSTSVALINGYVGKTQLVNSRLTVDKCCMNADTTSWAIDATSSVTVSNAFLDGGFHPVVVRSIASAVRPIGNFSPRFRSPHRIPSTASSGVRLLAQPYNGAGPWAFTGTAAVNATSVADGKTYATCAEITLLAGRTEFDNATTVTITNGKWYCVTLDAKHVSGTLANTAITLSNGVSLSGGLQLLFETSKWQTAAVVGKCTSTGTISLRFQNVGVGTEVWRFGALQVIEFDDEQAMIDFYNSGITRST